MINLKHEVKDMDGRVVIMAEGMPAVTIADVLITSLGVATMDLAQQIGRADLIKKIQKCEDGELDASGQTLTTLTTCIGGYSWPPTIIPDVLEQVDPGKLKELRDRA